MLPEGFVARMRRLLGEEEFAQFLSAYDRPRNVGLRRNPRYAAVKIPFCGEPVAWEPNGCYYDPTQRPGLHPYHEAGVYYLQEPSAMAPARLLDAQPGERVLDLCAAPGGKTTQIAAMLQGEGLLVCNEIHPKRAQILSSNIERLGVANALVLNEHPAKLAERFVQYFDRILVDAPCSGEGMFRKEEAAGADWSEETVAMCAGRQSEILTSAAKMLRPNGRLVYSTCTFAPEENEGVICRFLRENPDFEVETVDAPWFSPGRPDWIGESVPDLEKTFRLLPHKLKGEGHFAAVLRKNGGTAQEQRLQPAERLPEPIAAFLEEFGVTLPAGKAVSFGDMWYFAPEALPELRGLKVLRAGLQLGEVRKSRFVPSHALSHWLRDFPVTADFAADSREIAAYLRGETLFGEQHGWVLVCAGGCGLGWARGSGGILKNHYPKGLRRF